MVYHSKASPTKDEPRLLETVIDISKPVLLSSQSIASFLSHNLASSQPKYVSISPKLPHTLLSFSDNPPSCPLTPDRIQIRDPSATKPYSQMQGQPVTIPTKPYRRLPTVCVTQQAVSTAPVAVREIHAQSMAPATDQLGTCIAAGVRISHGSRRTARPACRHCGRWTQPSENHSLPHTDPATAAIHSVSNRYACPIHNGVPHI